MNTMEKEMKKLEELAMIQLNAEELCVAKKEIEKANQYISQIQATQTTKAIELGRKINLENLREDVAKPGLENSVALQNAPDKKGNAYRVPKVVG